MDKQNKLKDSVLSECVVCDNSLGKDTKVMINNILGGTVYYYCSHCESVYDSHDELLVVSMKDSNNIVGVS